MGAVGAGTWGCIGLGSPSVGLRNSHDQQPNLIAMVGIVLDDPSSVRMTVNKTEQLIKTIG